MNLRNTNWIVDPFTQVKSAETWQKIIITLRACLPYRSPIEQLWTKSIFTHARAKTSQALRSAVKKTSLNSSKLQLHSEKLSFAHKKETEHSFELSLFICVFYRAYFQSWNTKFSLENHNMMNARQPFCWWITVSEVSNPPLPPLSMWLTM